VLHTFTGGADGASPLAGLIRDSAGNLYGAASLGGDPSRKERGARGGFTLIELIIVTIILLILTVDGDSAGTRDYRARARARVTEGLVGDAGRH
jgi:prepilin-type N-terminal cleavage/methylation domain-containing protein